MKLNVVYLSQQNKTKQMEEKFKLVENKKELFVEVSKRTGRVFGTVKNHWFNPVNVPDKYKSVVEEIIDKTLNYQIACKNLHQNFFGN